MMTEPRELPPLSDAQMEIMNFVWDRGEATVGEVWRALAARRDLARVHCADDDRPSSGTGLVALRVARACLSVPGCRPARGGAGMMVRRLLDSAFGGSAEGLVLALLDGRGLTSAESKRIRVTIQRAEETRAKTRGGKP